MKKSKAAKGQHKNTMNRRKFLGTASCAAIGTTTFFSSLFNLGMTNEAAARSSVVNKDYKALVCILLAGGNDSFNMLIPNDAGTYAEYATTRANLAIKKDHILGLKPLVTGQPMLGLHPSMPEVQELFNKGDVAFLANVGTLVQPTSKAQYTNQSVSLPLGLFSHADQIQQWQTSIPQSRAAYGWGGRMADILQSMNTNQNISMNISLSGRNVFQSGNKIAEYSIEPRGLGSVGIRDYGGDDMLDQIRTTAVKSLMEQQYADVFTKAYADVVSGSQATHEIFSKAIQQVNVKTVFSKNEISQSLQMVAKTIAARKSLNVNRQTFFITFGGWDHHDRVLKSQRKMLAVLSKALKEFNTAMQELQTHHEVTTFTISDFGRTLTSNGNGTDHAWGGNVMMMGGKVKGGKVYGKYPSLALNSHLDVNNGVLLPTTSTDEYFAELARWFGVSNTDLADIFPNLRHFYSLGSTPPIGFMAS
ncbi:DUF1501 domain-containing protein [Microscilla marina]|uniref:Putative orphan protein n=1 Tax=Microscilla marina ATCC 23134 TaxID=313606 RepID=A1ZT69_MICM2|nr:DUF1501 domain-containing protein [Microscilla marina]EAY26458.1 putative orphan protein [Microscilla marina ATCC 23134]